MVFNKSYFAQFKEEIDQEVKDFDAHTETTKVNLKHCNHKNAKMIGNQLRCSCGACYEGPGLAKLLELLNGVTMSK